MFEKLKKKIKEDIHLKEILKSSFISLSLRIVGIILGYIFVLLVTRNYGAEAMGIFALSIALLQIFSIIGRLGTDTAVVRFVSEYNTQGKHLLVKEIYTKILKTTIPASLLLSFFLFFTSPYLAKYIFNKEYLYPYFQLVALCILPFVIFNINSQALRGLKKIKEFTFLQNISLYLFSSLILLVLFSYKEKYIPLISYSLGIFITLLISYLMFYQYFKKFFKLKKVNINIKISYKTVLSVALPMLLIGSLNLIMKWTDIVMLGIFTDEKSVGIYNVAVKVSTMTAITLAAINSIAAPKFAEFWGKNDFKSLEKTVHQTTKLIFFSSIPILIIIWIFPSYILKIFGEEFIIGKNALLILSIGQFINAISGSVIILLNMTGKQMAAQNIVLIGALLNVVLNFVLIPIYGIIGAAIASMISVSFINLVAVFYIKKMYGFVTIYLPFFKRF